MDLDVKDQLISTIMKTFSYTKYQADYLFLQLMNCIHNKELVTFFLSRLKYFFNLWLKFLSFIAQDFNLSIRRRNRQPRNRHCNFNSKFKSHRFKFKQTIGYNNELE